MLLFTQVFACMFMYYVGREYWKSAEDSNTQYFERGLNCLLRQFDNWADVVSSVVWGFAVYCLTICV